MQGIYYTASLVEAWRELETLGNATELRMRGGGGEGWCSHKMGGVFP